MTWQERRTGDSAAHARPLKEELLAHVRKILTQRLAHACLVSNSGDLLLFHHRPVGGRGRLMRRAALPDVEDKLALDDLLHARPHNELPLG
jgi:hypothetical protein